MKKEEIAILAQILSTMKDIAGEIESAKANKNSEKIEKLKREMLTLQKKAQEILNG